jgi:hypothetical protein
MMEYAAAIILYLLGSLFMTMHFEPAEGGPRYMYVLLVFGWPLMTLYFAVMEIIGFNDEEE